MRAKRLPEDVRPYRTIGPFDDATLPAGLRRTHDLAEDTWGLVELTEGTISFVWEDEGGETLDLSAPAQIVVPPRVPHHVESNGAFRLSITFLRK